jgi:propanediol dehydratase small subunit
MTNNSENHNYPMMLHAAGAIRTSNGRRLTEITMENVESGVLSAEDMGIDAQTLLGQAKIARQAGLSQLATNLTRAAELTAVPNATLLEMYEMLRPGRSSFKELTVLATTMEEQFNAKENANLIREAAAVYRERGMLKRES